MEKVNNATNIISGEINFLLKLDTYYISLYKIPSQKDLFGLTKVINITQKGVTLFQDCDYQKFGLKQVTHNYLLRIHHYSAKPHQSSPPQFPSFSAQHTWQPCLPTSLSFERASLATCPYLHP